MNYKKVFGLNVRYYRKKKKYTQEEFAKKCSISRTYISEVELGKRNISIDNMAIIAKVLKVSICSLLVEQKDE